MKSLVHGSAEVRRSLTHPYRRRAAATAGAVLSAVTAAFLLVACAGDSTPEQRSRITGPVPFSYSIVDARPDSGKECCADILAVGDLNNDGFSDLVVGSQGGKAGLAWYQYPLWQKHVVAQGEFTTDGKIADIDGDGHADIVSGEMEQGFSWFRNPGRADHAPWARTIIDKGYVHDVEVADMDGDGDLDLVACSKKRVTLWRQEQGGSWSATVVVERKAEGLALADVNGDGRIDVVLGGEWYESPATATVGWAPHTIVSDWPSDTRVVVTDMSGDGRPDVIMSASEGPGRISWFEQPGAASGDGWLEHPVTRLQLEGAHSLQVADMDLDGDLDVVAAEMHTSPEKRVLVFLQSDDQWTPFLISQRGSHNLQVADIDADGDPDVIGKNYAGEGPRPLELWENQAANTAPDAAVQALNAQPGRWKYVAIDSARPPSQKGKMGLVFADLNQDGLDDVIAGSVIYRNPGKGSEKEWPKVALQEDFDAHFSVNVDDDGLPDIVGFAGTDIIWMEAEGRAGERWQARKVGVAPEGRVQGTAVAQIEPGKSPELLFTKGNSLAYLRIPATAAGERSWELTIISSQVEESGIAVADLDRDGDLDIAAVAEDGHHAIWFENLSGQETEWPSHPIGASALWMDRLAATDINGDGRLDLLASEESREGLYKARLYWFEAPKGPRQGPWRRRSILTLRSINSMDVADIDGDGVMEVVIAEHTDLRNGEWAPDNVTAVLRNVSGGSRWALERVEVDQHSSHLGAHVADLDGDGNKEIVSIAWEQYCCVHLWTWSGQ